MTWKRVKQVGSKLARRTKETALGIKNRLPGQDINPETPVRRMSRFDSSLPMRLKSIWEYCLLSLPIDILIFSSGIGALFFRRNAASKEILLLIVLCLALASLFRRDVLVGAILVRVIRNKFLFRSKKTVFLALLLIILAATFMDAYLRHHGKGLSAFIIPTLAALAAIIPAWRTIKERLQRLQRKARNRLIWVEELDRQHFLFLTISLFPVRLISLLSALFVQDPLSFAFAWLVSFSALLHLEPKESDFVVLCRKCLKKTSRSLAGMRYCPECSRVKFFVPEDGR